MITNLPITLSKEINESGGIYAELKIGRQVVSAATLNKGTSDALALSVLLAHLPRA